MITYHTEAGSPVVEIGVAGGVTNTDLEGWLTRLRVDVEENGKSRILEIIEDFSGIEPAAIWTDIKLGIPLARKVDRVAVVADQGWIRALSKVGGMFTMAEVRSFEPIELEEARTWIGSA
ncbi:MAG TPA: STAS/SEC14 domain-containing protein [Caulobacteraceae bacterium]|nr:STAS/SEC14 domain-containing protein [Caulobacteraceae bacterium]